MSTRQKKAGDPFGSPAELRRTALTLLAGSFYLKVVYYRAETESGAGSTNTRNILFHFVIHHALERYMTVIHDDVYGRHCLDGITREYGITEDGARDLYPQT